MTDADRNVSEPSSSESRGRVLAGLIKGLVILGGFVLLLLLASRSFREFMWNLTTSDAEKASYELYGNTDHADVTQNISADDLAEMKANEADAKEARAAGRTVAADCQKPGPNNAPFLITDEECLKQRQTEKAQ